MELVGYLPGSHGARRGGVQHVGPSPIRPAGCPVRPERGVGTRAARAGGASGWGRRAPLLRARPPRARGPVSANLSPRSRSRPRGGRRGKGGRAPAGPRAPHLNRGQGPGGCARGGGGVGGAGCRHFRSSPSLLSTCCCVGPAGTGRRVSRRRQDLGRAGRADPDPTRPGPPPASAHLCGAARPACWAPW